MSLVVDACKLEPIEIGAPGTVVLQYTVGSGNRTRACDRIFIGGVETPFQECFDVIGTRAFPQVEVRQIHVTPPAGVSSVKIRVVVREVTASNVPVDNTVKECTASLTITRT